MTPPEEREWSRIRELLETVDRTIPALDAAFGPRALAALRSVASDLSPDQPPGQRRLRVRTHPDPDAALGWAIGQSVRRAREKAGLRQEDLAESTGIARPNIVRIERGTHLPSLSTLRRLAEALQTRISELVIVPLEGDSDLLRENSELAEAGLSDWTEQFERDDHKP